MAAALTPKTTIATLLNDYPFLLPYLAGYHPEFKKLTNPVARRTVGRLATVERVAGIAGVPVATLLGDIADEIAAKTGSRPEVARTAAGGIDPERQRELKAIIGELHAGRTPAEVKPRFEALIQGVEATEIAAMEQALIEEGLPDTEVKRLCDVHMQVFQEALDANPVLCAPAGHPVDTFQRENRAVLEVTRTMREAADRVGKDGDVPSWRREKPALADALQQLSEYERHFVRKENELFPLLEKHGVAGPSKVMWALHDDIRTVSKELRGAVSRDDVRAAVHSVDETATMIEDMVNKEEKVLFPMALDVLSEHEWRKIRAGETDIGYALIADVPPWPEEGEPEVPPAETPPMVAAGSTAAVGGTAAASATPAATSAAPHPSTAPLPLETGALAPEQIALLLGALPIDVTFVDENDVVRFYSEGERIFPRSPGVIGRTVQNCHPPASVYKVQEILDAFRAGEKSAADFWIQREKKFVHIRYFALRDGDGTYRGVLEVVQDVTAIRALQGERRLVDW
jgi:DUF438 domain-containing protein